MSISIFICLIIFCITTITIMADFSDVSVEHNLKIANGKYMQGDFEEASLLYRRCLEQDPNQPDCHCNLASLLLDTGDNEGAEDHYRRAIEVTDSKHAGALYNLALLLQESHETDKLNYVKQLYRKLLELEPDNIDAWSNLGAVLHQTGDLSAAILVYDRAIQLYSAG
jgi:tetratricopeptide (TPR) repeat protein